MTGTEQALRETVDRCAARNLVLEFANEDLRARLSEARVAPWWHERYIGVALAAVLVASAVLMAVVIVLLLVSA